ncbi:tyrosine--tRNA ligase [Candidatus Kaiserbacteria bacterium RIFCSPHIGHO2_12_FULL_56_13]|uniref:Tyrosine--tRNA ligase n=1 Tax=Candidatus Kaiserbacteria bacterium RIFCSPHIGHO2_12_FULL_56_13 TaxID=1798505 RepID=A0A1F6EEN3_9BACT|nr:MAG: tyrosine--tRNA ligase [Candidatus Kaiserbacteria bacterium RIFCSPHIGHO2_12_FULL_56_13]
MNLAEELKRRGLIEQSSAPVEVIFKEPRTVYLGIDPTADSLQIGNLAVVLLMKRLALAGHKLIFLVGGGTGMIGDPREKGERVLLDEKTLARNTRALSKQLYKLLPGTPFRMLDNAAWLTRLGLVPFLREIGKLFTVNDLVKRDIIARRLATPDESISFTEFSYALLQGYDYLVLNEKYKCDLQIGASDQWTNILSGVELIRKRAGREAYAFTMPLITDSMGKKFGKSEGNAVWLDPLKTTPFVFYQFWLNVPDEGIEKYLKVYTFLPLAEIEALVERQRKVPNEREGQKALARLVSALAHGETTANHVALATEALFGPTPFEELSREKRAIALTEAPSLKFTKADLTKGYSLIDALVAGGLASSKSDARRLIESRGITLGGTIITDLNYQIGQGSFNDSYALVRKGRREVLLLVLK